ncbi:MAG: nucleotide pyrophosphohydrolase [Planctomycetota bacterium]
MSDSSPSGAGKVSDSVTTVAELKRCVQKFVDERNWAKFHDAKNLSMSLAIEAGELMEHFQWLRSEQVAEGVGYEPAEVREELADVVSYAMALANALDIDVATAIEEKMVKNRLKYPADDPDVRELGRPPACRKD